MVLDVVLDKLLSLFPNARHLDLSNVRIDSECIPEARPNSDNYFHYNPLLERIVWNRAPANRIDLLGSQFEHCQNLKELFIDNTSFSSTHTQKLGRYIFGRWEMTDQTAFLFKSCCKSLS